MKENLNFEQTYNELTLEEMQNCVGGLAITIMGVTFVGFKAAAIIASGVTSLAGVAGLGIWNGYKDTKK